MGKRYKKSQKFPLCTDLLSAAKCTHVTSKLKLTPGPWGRAKALPGCTWLNHFPSTAPRSFPTGKASDLSHSNVTNCSCHHLQLRLQPGKEENLLLLKHFLVHITLNVSNCSSQSQWEHPCPSHPLYSPNMPFFTSII